MPFFSRREVLDLHHRVNLRRKVTQDDRSYSRQWPRAMLPVHIRRPSSGNSTICIEPAAKRIEKTYYFHLVRRDRTLHGSRRPSFPPTPPLPRCPAMSSSSAVSSVALFSDGCAAHPALRLPLRSPVGPGSDWEREFFFFQQFVERIDANADANLAAGNFAGSNLTAKSSVRQCA